MTIAIDGPSASGKSTVGELLAKRLDYLYFDTGVMYRAVTCMALRHRLDVNDEARVSALAEQIRIDVLPPSVADGRQNTILADGEDITHAIRSREIDANVSVVSSYRRVRDAMVRQQRAIGERGRVVMIGRDIGTVVLPAADVKVYLTASVEERARRRFVENVARSDATAYAEVLRLMQRRDELDTGRVNSPLRPAADAHIVDSDRMSVAQVVDAIERLWQA
ncbi:MAG: (d)CMP kinase [Chloroflexota bacterium]